jgi:hypothetical protein
MKIFIDFDDVIFNTKQFGSDLRDLFTSLGISEELFAKHYYAQDNKDKIKLFDPEGLFLRLEMYENIDVTVLRENFSKKMVNLTEFIFSDVKPFLQSFNKKDIYLISFGLASFQNQKIVASGIDSFINGCVVTRSSKAEAIAEIISQMKIDKNEKCIFIDDRVEQIQVIKEFFPTMCTFFLKRSEGRYGDIKNTYCDYEVHDLKSIIAILHHKRL